MSSESECGSINCDKKLSIKNKGAKTVSCKKCRKVFHAECSGLDSAKCSEIIAKNLAYYCVGCKQENSNRRSSYKLRSKSTSSQSEKVKPEDSFASASDFDSSTGSGNSLIFGALKLKQSGMAGQFEQLMEKLNNLEIRFVGLEKSVKPLKTLPQIESSVNCSNDLLKNLQSEVQQLREENTMLRTRIEALESRPTVGVDVSESLTRRVEELETKPTPVVGEDVALRQRIADLEAKLPNNLEPKCEMRAIEIHGIPTLSEGDRSNLYTTAKEFLKDSLNMTVEISEMDDCFYVAGRPARMQDGGQPGLADRTDNPPVSSGAGQTVQMTKSRLREPINILIIRFTTRRLRDEAFSAWRKKRTTKGVVKIRGTAAGNFHLRERLSKSTRKFLGECKEAARKAKWSFVWTWQGNVLARKGPGQRIFNINNASDIEATFK